MDYFQSFAKFHESGLPSKLPAREEAAISQHPEILDLESEVHRLKGEYGYPSQIQAAVSKARACRLRLTRKRLQQYKLEWGRERRDWKVMTRGQGRAEDQSQTNMEIYTTVLGAEKPACCPYDSGKERTTSTGIPYFHVECHLLDFNGQVFGEVSTALGIRKLPGAKRVDRLEAFPLEFHPHQKEIREYFIRYLWANITSNIVAMPSTLEQGEYVEVPVDSRIMVDVAYFRKINPNYTRPHINELARPSSANNDYIFCFSETNADEVKTNGLDTTTMGEGDLMICSQTVYGWSLGNKRWRKPSFPEHSIRWNLCL